LSVFDKAVQLSPDDAELWKQLGGVLKALDRPTDALASYRHALQLNPCHWEAAYQSSVLLYQLERFAEALDRLNLCDELQGDHAPTLQMRARVLRALKRYEECLADDLRAHALDPTAAITCNNIGDALLWLGRHREGLEWFDKALDLQPDHVEVLFNKGFALLQLNRFDEAGDTYRRLKALDPNDGKAGWQLAHLQLLTGDFEAGWAEREARWKVAGFSPDYPTFSQPKWLGEEPIAGKTILVHVDEGLGDAIQFARYVPMLAARGVRIILVVQAALCPLLSGLPGVAACLPVPAGRLPAFDMHCPITSLPLAFRTTLETIPTASYLPALPRERVQVWRQRLGSHHRLRVGLVWSGNPKQGNDRNRSMPFKTLTPLLDLGATFMSLQKDPRPEDKPALSERADIVDVTADLTDFLETAALIANLDLVITVCTSVAHLSATLGRPTWIMLPYIGDWRWLLDRNDSPWYPAVRLFRQDETRDYAGVIAQVRTELAARIAAFETGKTQDV
ncbi:tetratricopeptide repeat protein, partial [Bradyrhizobium sp.]|uniref:tetratricopeptide repeat-containing glycosyltransferase family protein n=1 Tax=Bradyrhizobium sp. TaxID=376 RepID=UPI003C5716D7